MAMSAEHRSKFAALHWQWWHLHMSEKFSSGTKNPKQTNKSLIETFLVDGFWFFHWITNPFMSDANYDWEDGAE